jgi:NitT/TauT family transport system permease protein/sulfonate transport system permease protein
MKAADSAGVGRRVAERLLAEGLVVAALAGWWLMSLKLPAFVLPGPQQVLKALGALFFEPSFLVHTAASAARVVASVLIALALGFALALLARRVALLADVIHRRLLPVLNSFPSVGWAILATVWFPPNSAAVMFVQVMILTPFCLINAAEGLKDLDTELIEMARSFGRSRRRILVKVLMPLLAPYLLAAARIAYGVAWKIALVSELFGADSGLGYVMLRAQVISDAATVFAACLAIVLIFVAGEKLVIDPVARRLPRH